MASKFHDGVVKKQALDGQYLGLFARGPSADLGDPAFTFMDNIEIVPRTDLTLSDIIDIRAPISSEKLVVYDNDSTRWAPDFFSWAGKRVPARYKEFQAFMAYYHVSNAHSMVDRIKPKISFRDSKGADILPLQVNYAVEGNPYSASYDSEKHQINFYQSSDLTFNNLNFVVSGEAIAHEYSHVLQQALNADFLEGANTHFSEALLEGLADFFVGATVGADDILQYLNSSYLFVDDLQSSIGPNPLRTMGHALSLPNDYVADVHQDGRIVAGALNDFRKYLAGEKITFSNCEGNSNCDRQRTSGAVSSRDAFDQVFNLSFTAFKNLGLFSKQTFYSYSVVLINTCNSPGAGINSWCAQHSSVLGDILSYRGLYFTSLVTTLPVIKKDAGDRATIDVVIEDELGWATIEDSSGQFSDGDDRLSPCEVVKIFPNVTNLSGQAVSTAAGDYVIRARLKSISGVEPWALLAAKSTPVVVEKFFPKVTVQGQKYIGESLYKDIGVLKRPSGGAAENTRLLMNNFSSRYYQAHHGSFFVKNISAQTVISEFDSLFAETGAPQEDFYRPNGGWMVKVLPTTNINVKATFDIKVIPLNSDMEEVRSVDTSAMGIELKDVEQVFQADDKDLICGGS